MDFFLSVPIREIRGSIAFLRVFRAFAVYLSNGNDGQENFGK
jgi:hypothetical protein